MAQEAPKSGNDNPIPGILGSLACALIGLSAWNWITGKGGPDVTLSKIAARGIDNAFTKNVCISYNSHLGHDLASQLCTCRLESIRKLTNEASNMEQIRQAQEFSVNYCEPIAKSYSEAARYNSPPQQSTGNYASNLDINQLAAQRSRLLYEMAIRQAAETGATMRSMLSSNPYASFSSKGFNLSGIFPSGYSGVIDEGAQRYRVQITSPETFTISECRAVDCAY
jgi:hypothetical protein